MKALVTNINKYRIVGQPQSGLYKILKFRFDIFDMYFVKKKQFIFDEPHEAHAHEW